MKHGQAVLFKRFAHVFLLAIFHNMDKVRHFDFHEKRLFFRKSKCHGFKVQMIQLLDGDVPSFFVSLTRGQG